jgi:hypothetical protein
MKGPEACCFRTFFLAEALGDLRLLNADLDFQHQTYNL